MTKVAKTECRVRCGGALLGRLMINCGRPQANMLVTLTLERSVSYELLMSFIAYKSNV